MKRLKRTISLLLVVFTLAAALCGCGGGKQGVGDGNQPEGDSTPSQEQSGGNTITVGIAQDLDDSLDPHKMAAAGTREVLFNVFEGLVKPDSNGNLIPAVASNVDISESGDTFTFTLREGVKFHNGDPVTVGDVVYSLERCKGLGEGESLITAFEEVESVTAPDEQTIVVKTYEPNIEFLAYLTAAIIPEGYEEQDTAPVGTGPFRFVSRSAQENIVLERFDGYWGEPAFLDGVTFKIIDNASTLVMSLKSGAIDLCAHLTAAQAAELQDFTVLEGTMNLVQAVYLNNAVEPFDNVKVRQALCYAVDKQEIMDFLADGRGTRVGSSMYPSFGKYFMPELADYYTRDTEKAMALLAEAGYPDGFSMTITVPSNYQPHIDTATVVADQLADIGITATIQTVEWSTWLSDVYQGRNFQSTVVGFDASAMTARAMLERWGSTNGKNMINFNDPDYDAALEQAMAATDDAEQVALYKECQTILAEQAANVYIQDLCDLVAMKPGLTGYAFYPLYVMDLSTVQWTASE
jgi:peptide/nickel transport system substrate-binding protein